MKMLRYLGEMRLQNADKIMQIGSNYYSAPSVLHSNAVIRTTSRMSVAKLKDGSLWVHSAIQPTIDVRAQLDAIGPVKHIIIPNK
jgi:hypothetical protein